jgi:predicted deacylase
VADFADLVYDFEKIDFDRPGKHHYRLAFPLDSSWGYSLVPFTVINGLRHATSPDPPGVVVFGGTHGNEWEGQIAAKRLCAEIDPADFRGRLILVPQLSESACNANQRISPADGVNMNRAFPGRPNGSLSSRIAHFVTSSIFPRVRIVIDIHSGGNEAVFPLCASLHPIPDPAQFQETLAAARLFDTPFIFVYSRQMASGLLTDQAEDEGKIALGGEFGFSAGVNPKGVRHAYHGVLNVLRKYGHLVGETVKIDTERNTSPTIVEAPALHDYIPCPRDGIWELLLPPGADVREGDVIGYLHDFSNHVAAPLEIRAHRDGVLIAAYFSALCRKGLTLFVIGRRVEFT